jgi:micrococcal nuclease
MNEEVKKIISYIGIIIVLALGSFQVDSVQGTSTKTSEKLPTIVPGTYYTVTDVVDGDTIKINVEGSTVTIRLIGVDTPETVDPRKPVQCFGKEASSYLESLLLNTAISLAYDEHQDSVGAYNRINAYVYTQNGLFVNHHLIEEGYAYEYTYDPKYQYQSLFKQAQRNAEINQRGLWSPDTCNSVPSEAIVIEDIIYHTSSWPSSQYYYPSTCNAWKILEDSSYHVSFSRLDALQREYTRTLSPQCE